jgi:hypothetical protein
MKYFTALLAITMIACNERIPAGGPCRYTTQPFRFTVVSIEKDTSGAPAYLPDSLLPVRIRLCCDLRHSDTFFLSSINNKTITVAMARGNRIIPGSTIEGKVDLITSGTCTPEIYVFDQAFLQ